MEKEYITVFPAYAGMSLTAQTGKDARKRFPRLRGDEPYQAIMRQQQVAFSPPTRG